MFKPAGTGKTTSHRPFEVIKGAPYSQHLGHHSWRAGIFAFPVFGVAGWATYGQGPKQFFTSPCGSNQNSEAQHPGDSKLVEKSCRLLKHSMRCAGGPMAIATQMTVSRPGGVCSSGHM